MQALGLNEIRERYLRFFEGKAHLRLPSFSLVPKDDPSVLLINAGMTPMKPYFTGQVTPPSTRVTTCQKCIRTPDIDRVGLTSRHGTFFEMLGNFSFGDYFKEEIIPWAWEFLTEDLGIPAELLSVSVYFEDDEAYDIWHKKVGLPENKIFRMGKEDNFWEHGTGPCGPCSEIYFDRGERYGCASETCRPGCDCDRYVEIWNLVFSQFDRQEDGSYLPLKQKNIDTGGGLERFACMMQGVDNLFEVDTVRSTLDRVCEIAGKTYHADAKDDVAIRVVTDHIRSTVMMIGDGITPSNTGRGYVLRRLLRRAARYGRLLGIDGPFLCALAEDVILNYGEAYPELREHRSFILTVIEKEEQRFDRTIRQGMAMLERSLEDCRREGREELDAKIVFLLHDTYGFPLDLTREIAEESAIRIDETAFSVLMKEQKRRAQEALLAKGESAWTGLALPAEVDKNQKTEFTGYDRLESEAVLKNILLIPGEGQQLIAVEELSADDAREAILIFDRTPFYAEGGGQVGDRGVISSESGSVLRVLNTTKPDGRIFLHRVLPEEGQIRVGETYRLSVDRERRRAVARNHSATHLLHRALREILGSHVKQAGSYVGPDRLRFDFSHFEPIGAEELRSIEARVNRFILEDYPVTTELMSMEDAKKSGAMALFNEKYGERVRVVTMGPSKELCGGTHLSHSSEACYFRLISEQSVAAGVRRIEACTGAEAFRMAGEEKTLLASLAAEMKVQNTELPQRIERLREDLKQSEKKLRDMQQEKARAELGKTEDAVREVGAARRLVSAVRCESMEDLRELCETLRDRFAPAAVLLGAEIGDKLQFVCMVSEELIEKNALYAGELVKAAAQAAGGGGGGRKNMAQAGARDVGKMNEALLAAETLMCEKLGG